MLDKIYLEITNVCNLNCSFCHKTSREKRLMSDEEFDILTDKLRGKAKYLYFHLMGEPTLHPHLFSFIDKAKDKGFTPIITTNGSLLREKGELLLRSLPYKISISLHAPEANPAFSDEGYIASCIDFAKKAASGGCFVALRLWNLGSDADNSQILAALHQAFPDEWVPVRGGSGERLAHKIFLEWGERFDWPDENAPEEDEDADIFCYALRNHAGVLVDGTLVPCCLDSDGAIPLGNLFEEELEDILSSPRAKKIYDSFTRHRASESFCRKCGFVKKFRK